MAGTFHEAGRIWTTNFGWALFAVSVGLLFAFLPAGMNMLDLHFRHNHSGYDSFVSSLDELYLGALAVALSASLTYFETHFLDELDFGRACNVVGGLAIFCAVLALIGYFVVHFLVGDDNGFANISIVFLFEVTGASSLTIIQGRRVRDLDNERAAA